MTANIDNVGETRHRGLTSVEDSLRECREFFP